MKTRLLIIIGIITISITTVLWIEYGMICNDGVIEHLQKYSNVFEKGTTLDTFVMNEVGLEFGVHGLNLKECVESILENKEK